MYRYKILRKKTKAQITGTERGQNKFSKENTAKLKFFEALNFYEIIMTSFIHNNFIYNIL